MSCLGPHCGWTWLEGFNQRKIHTMTTNVIPCTPSTRNTTVLVPTTFAHEIFGTIRALMLDGTPWFIGKGVCDALGYANSRDALAAHLEDDEKGVAICATPGGRQSQTVISESGLYALILRSNKPEARPFRKWLTSSVLPSIRQHGGYLTGQEGLSPALVATLHKTIKENALPALRYYDKLTEHDHWKSQTRCRASAEWAIQETALKFDLPVSLVEKLTMQGVSALEA